MNFITKPIRFAIISFIFLVCMGALSYINYDNGRIDRALKSVEMSIYNEKSAPFLSESVRSYKNLEYTAHYPESKELFRRVRLDQTYRNATEYEVRKRLLGFGASDADINKLNSHLWANINEVDLNNRLWLNKTLDKIEWFKISKYGVHASNGAWLLIQHGDLDLNWQKKMLVILKSMAQSGEASLKDVAYLEDRINIAENKPQLYGTQGYCEGGDWKAYPIKSPNNIDASRSLVGLNSLVDYKKQLFYMCQK